MSETLGQRLSEFKKVLIICEHNKIPLPVMRAGEFCLKGGICHE